MTQRVKRRSRPCRWISSALGCGIALGFSTPALANGRFPRAEQLLQNPNDSQQLWLATTYGLLTSQDHGGNWHLVCEAGFALDANYLGDPLLAMTVDGDVLVGLDSTINVTRDSGCQWTPSLGSSEEVVRDYAVALSSPSTIIAVVKEINGASFSYTLRQSTDGGASWRRVGAPLPASIVYTVDMAPDDPRRIYATGLDDSRMGRFFASNDGGASWRSEPLPGTDSEAAPYIAGIHPTNANRIFVRTDAWVLDEVEHATETANDALLYSADAGRTWREVFRSQAKLFGFALSPDGATILVGYGDPRGTVQVVPGPFGVFRSASDRFSFEKISDVHANCLTWTTTGVYLCGSEVYDGFELAFWPAAELAETASCAAALLRQEEIRGAVDCPSGTTSAICESAWQGACATFGACGTARASPSSGCASTLEPPTVRAAGGGIGCGCDFTRGAPGVPAPLCAFAFAFVICSVRRCAHRNALRRTLEPR
jgi:hypothetical protein